jgi:hypothetical protein
MLLAGAMAQASTLPMYYLSTGQTGAQTQIDIDHSSTWSFTPTVPWQFGGGYFTMKAGSKTIEPIVFRFYVGSSASSLGLIAQVTLNNAQFCAQAPCNQYNVRDFHLVSPVQLSAGTAYFASLTSAAPDNQSEAYFIKASSSFTIVDRNGGLITPAPIVNPSGNTDSPEPGPGLLMAVSAATLAVVRKRQPKFLFARL